MKEKRISVTTPGNQGRGIPTLRWIFVSSPLVIISLLVRGEGRHAWHRIIATAADFWNFYIVGKIFQHKVQCPCCGWKGPSFRATANWRAVTFQSVCPECDSRSRHRGLMKVLEKVVPNLPSGPILVVAPERVILKRLSELTSQPIYTTDLNRLDVDFPNEDIQALSFKDGTFVLVICNHVLEHVPDDQMALKELARILKPGGAAVITIPGDFRQWNTWYFDKPDSNGHYRHYGMDVTEKMRMFFSRVLAIDMGQITPPAWKVRKGDYAFICFKGNGS